MSKRKIINAVLDIEGAAVLWAPMTVILFFFMFGLLNVFTGGKLDKAASLWDYVFVDCIGNGDIIIGIIAATVFLLACLILCISYGLYKRKKGMKILNEELDKLEFDTY